jgi:dolichol-phosphate mannosyltransferase
MGKSSSDIIVILPTYKEPEGVKLVIKELVDVLDPFILVIDRPTGDSTGKNAEKLGATVLTQRGKGKGSAIREILEYLECRRLNHKYLIMMDADYTYPVKYIPKMIDILESNPDVGMVTGRRPESRKLDIYPLGNLLLRFAHFLFNGISIHDPFTGLRIIRFNLIKNWRPKSNGFDIECEINYFINKIKGFKVIEIPIEYRPRIGEKKLMIKHGATILKRILLMSLSYQ